MQSLVTRILRRVRAHGRGKWVFTPKDFLDLGNRAAVDRVLSRLVQKDLIRRIGRGLYDLPRISGILKRPAPPNVDLAVKAIARRDRLKIAPDGIFAANQLGLTNAVPAKNAYITEGISKTLKIGDRTVQFQHACQKIAQWIDRPGDRVIRALSWLGKGAATDPSVINTLRTNTPNLVKADLMKGLDNLPVWMRSIVRNICDDSLIETLRERLVNA
jgi:Family of unknown function (DUF6088)